MTTTTKSGRSARTNSWVTVLSILGILVLLNVLGMWVFGKADVTDNQRYTLSDVSKDAVRTLDGVEVQVFISEDLPPTVAAGYGRERDIRGVGRELLDKLAEYQSYSGGKLAVTVVRDEIEDRAQKAKLELFTGKSAQVEAGRLEFKKYALGATFQYRNQMEVFPLAMEPETFEFEITKILLRLKEKYEKSTGMKDLLDAGAAVADAAKACNEKLESYRKKGGDKPAGLGALVGGGDMLAALRVDRQAFNKTCNAVAEALVRLEGLKGRNESLDQLALTARGFVEMLDELSRQLDDPKGGQAALVAERLGALYAAVDKDHDGLKNAPGRKAIGFLCGHREFCPFADETPMIRPEIAGMLGQNNPLVQQFVSQATQIEGQINQINEQIRRGLFVRRGLNLKRVDSGEDIPDDVEVLVIYGPQRALTDRDRYNIDQFLLSGRSVIVFAGNFDVAVYNIKQGAQDLVMSEMTFDDLHREAYPTNLAEMLASYGVRLNQDLVLEPKSFEPITIIQLQKQGQFTLQSQHDFPYPLLPTFSDMDRSHVLVRRLSSITMPYVSTLSLTDGAGTASSVTYTPLVRTSSNATATGNALELSPPELMRQMATFAPNGPHTVAMAAKGEFTSAFAGKAVPPRPEVKDEGRDMPKPKPVDRPFRGKGTGRLLVIGSTLGLENLSAEKVFDGFNMGQLTSGNADFFMKLKNYVAAFQNWQLRISQVTPVLQANLDFIFNCLDWGVQNEALVDIRSKGLVKRPIDTVSQGGQTAITLSMIVGLPLLFVLIGGMRFVTRRKKG